MEAVVFCGIPGAGKSSFYLERFYDTHVRLNLDMLRTRRREDILLRACLEAGQRFVADNTNVTVAQRAVYLQAAQPAHFRTVCFFFDVTVADALARNRERSGKAQVPEQAIRAMASRMVPPTAAEGFDALFRVRVTGGGFEVERWAR